MELGSWAGAATALVAVTVLMAGAATAPMIARWRSVPLLRPVALMMIGASLWGAVALGLRLTTDPHSVAAIVAYLLPAASISVLAAFWHARLLSGAPGLDGWWRYGLAVEPLLTVVAAAVAPWWQLVFVVRATGGAVEVIYRPLFYVHLGYTLTLFAATIVLYVTGARRAVPGERVHHVVAVLTYSIPFMSNMVALGAGLQAADASAITAIAVAPAPLVWWWGAVHSNRMHRVPLSATQVLTGMGDAVLVLRGGDLVVFANPQADALVRRWADPGPLVGRRLADSLPPTLAAALTRPGRLTAPDGTTVDLQVTAVGGAGRHGATIVAGRDVTEVERLRAELAEQAERDLLTELHNRRYLNRVLDPMVAAAATCGPPLTAAMIDVDNFKAINDHHGHAAGDRVLVEVARTLAASVRAGDVLVRFGGEEFLVLLPGARCTDVAGRAEHWRLSCAGLRIATGRGEALITVSIGLAEVRAGESSDDVLRRADSAMYAAKAAGRNRIAQASECAT